MLFICLQSEYRFAGGGYPRAGVGSSSSRSGGLCSAALVGGALLAAVAVLAVAALAFYMGALRPDNGERTYSILFLPVKWIKLS